MIVQFSFLMLFALGAAKLAKKLGLPALVGMMVTGICFGRYADALWMEAFSIHGFDVTFLQITPDLLGLSSDLRGIALVIILIRAGLGIKKNDLKMVGAPALRMSVLPALMEALFITLAAMAVLKLSILEAGLLGFVLAAVSPAVIVPKMLQLIDSGLGMKKRIPTLVLAGASLDDVLAITCFGVLLKFSSHDQSGWQMALFTSPLGVGIGLIFGIIIGFLLLNIFSKIPWRATEKMLIVLFAALLFRSLEHWAILPVCSLIGIMAMAFVILEKNEELGKMLAEKFNQLWIGAELCLFVLVGAEVDPRVIWQVGLMGVLVLALGLLGRSIGVLLSLVRTPLNADERKFCIMAYLPKATVQAAIGAVVLESWRAGSIQLPGAEQTGQLILAMAVLSILITAPLGAWLMDNYADRLLK
jgi:solute carrier family 9B (sodium/hydrogen exchanger), member 1/2